MKFIHGGATYDTATAKAIAVHRGAYAPAEGDPRFPAQQVRFENTLYRTPRGALFLHEHSTAKYAKGKPVVQDRVQPMNDAEAAAWLEKTGAAILDAENLPLPPEA